MTKFEDIKIHGMFTVHGGLFVKTSERQAVVLSPVTKYNHPATPVEVGRETPFSGATDVKSVENIVFSIPKKKTFIFDIQHDDETLTATYRINDFDQDTARDRLWKLVGDPTSWRITGTDVKVIEE